MTPSKPDDAFLREVDEGVRRDRAASLWKRYGIAAVVLVVLLLAALGGWLWWREEQVRRAGVAGEEFVLAMDKLEVGDRAAAQPVLDRLGTSGPEGYRPLAGMMQAAQAVSVGDNARAVRLLDAIAADAAVSQPLRDAATIKSVRLGFDTLPPAKVIARLKALSIPGDPWFGVAGEMTALAQVKAGQTEQAKPLLTAIVRDATNPPSLRTRAAQLALSLGVDAAALRLPEAAAVAPEAAVVDAPAPPAAAPAK